jgi:hypothetical protein
MSDETKSVLDETNSAKQCQTVLANDGMYFGLLTHPKEEETMRQYMVKDPCAYCLSLPKLFHSAPTGAKYNSQG